MHVSEQPRVGEVKGDGSGRSVDRFIYWFPFAFLLPVFEVHVKSGYLPYLLARVALATVYSIPKIIKPSC